MERHQSFDRAAALAGAVACELNDHLTVILNGLSTEITGPENLAAVERASARCAAISRGLMRYAYRYGRGGRPAPLDVLLDPEPR